MEGYPADEALDSLYSEELPALPSAPRKHGWLKKAGVGLAVISNMLFGQLDKGHIGPREALAQGNGYLSISLCPRPATDYLVFFVTPCDPVTDLPIGPAKEIAVPGDLRRLNITGLTAGGVYEVKAKGCNVYGCSDYTANRPLGVARLYGNVKIAPSGTTNRVDGYDTSFCLGVYNGTNRDPTARQMCDFNGDGVPNTADYNILRANYAWTQANPMGLVYVDCSGGRCPETGPPSCEQPY